MLLKDHIQEIDHIIHDLEQIESTSFDDGRELNPLEHSRILAKETIDEFMVLLDELEREEFDHSGIVYDSLMIRKMTVAAYYMSRFRHEKLFGMGLTMEETSERCADIIGCNVESILQMKMLFDNYRTVQLMGSDQKVILTDDMRRCMEEYDAMTEDEAALACRMEFRRKSLW